MTVSQDFEIKDDEALRLREALQAVAAGLPSVSDESTFATLQTATDNPDDVATIAAHHAIPPTDLDAADAGQLAPAQAVDTAATDVEPASAAPSGPAWAQPSFPAAAAPKDLAAPKATADMVAPTDMVDVGLRDVVTPNRAAMASSADHAGAPDQPVTVQHLHWQAGQTDSLQAPSDLGKSLAASATPANAVAPADQIIFSAHSADHDVAPTPNAPEIPTASAVNSMAELDNAGLDGTSASLPVSWIGVPPGQVLQALGGSGAIETGAGIKVGVLSDSFNDLGGAVYDEADGMLPPAGSIQILKDLTFGGADEGRAMMQIVHDIAPGASLAFYTAEQSEQDFANGILALAAAGCKVICDDVNYFDEPFFQNGIVAQAIQTVEAEGVTYITSAGNNGSAAYQAAWTPISGSFDGVALNDAENFGGSIVQTITASAGVPLLLEWNQAYGQATSNLELLVFHNGALVGTATNSSSGEPSNPWLGYQFTASGTYQIAIENLSGPNPGLIKEIAAGNGLPVTISGANVGTVFGHAMTPGVITAGAVDGAVTPFFGYGALASESFASSGAGTELLFADDGTALSSPQMLNPVAVSGIDDIFTTVSDLHDFYGTSAASASLAGVAALILAADPNLTPAQVEQIMQETALPMANPAVSGSGLVQINLAITAAQIAGGTVIESSGSTSLVQVGNDFFLDNVSVGFGPELKYAGTPVTVGEFGNTVVIGAAQTATGYDIAWKDPSTGQFTFTTADSNGNYTSNICGWVSGTSTTTESLEITFSQDFNGDGTIGFPTTLIQTDGSTSLVQIGNQYGLYSNGAGPTIKIGGAAVVVGQFGSTVPIGAIQTTSGYDIAWKDSSTGLFTFTTADSNGNYTSNISGWVPGTSATAETLETTFHQDFNGDGVVGLPPATVIQVDGSTSLVQIGNEYGLYNNGAGPTIKIGGAAVVIGQLGSTVPIGAIQAGSTYDIAWKDPSTGLFTFTTADGNGNYISNISGWVSGTSPTAETLEATFHQDFNGDGVIGVAATVIQTDGSTSLVQIGNEYGLYTNGSGPTINIGGAPVVVGQLGSTIPIGAVQTASGYDIAWKDPSTDQFTFTTADNAGNYTSNISGWVSGTSATAETLETTFHQDFNGDGVIGAPATHSVSVPSASAALSEPAGQTGPGAQASALFGSAHDAFEFAQNFTSASFALPTNNIAFSKPVFAMLETPIAAIHHDIRGDAAIIHAAHDTITVPHVTSAELLAHLTDFHLL